MAFGLHKQALPTPISSIMATASPGVPILHFPPAAIDRAVGIAGLVTHVRF
jgi:hypothetical protein